MADDKTKEEQEKHMTDTNDDPKPGASSDKSEDSKAGSSTKASDQLKTDQGTNQGQGANSNTTTSDTGITEDISERGVTSQASSGERSGNQSKSDQD